MLILYNIGIRLYYFIITILQHFNPKARLWLEGRKNIFEKISNEVDPALSSIWFHFASLGEFEQGRPVLDRAKELYPAHKIIVTFFSPSGYVLRKSYKNADHVFYLPLDTSKNAKRFIELINPSLVIFTKYEFWYHFFYQISKKNIPLIIISAIFRSNQPFFKWHGMLNRKMLRFVTHFFVQDENSRKLLATININDVTVSGDTRLDRVATNAKEPRRIHQVETFCGNAKVFVAGSTWHADEKLLAQLIRQYDNWKFIIAPHEVKEEKIIALEELLSDIKTIRFSHEHSSSEDARVLIIDNIGMLSSLYQYGVIAYIGGGFGVGIHNTLEAAAFGLPVIFGPNYHKFNEARALLKSGAGFTIKSAMELTAVMKKLQDEEIRKNAGNLASLYVQQHKGATEKILNYLKKALKQ